MHRFGDNCDTMVENRRKKRTPLSFDAPPQRTLGYIFAADSMALSSFIFFVVCSERHMLTAPTPVNTATCLLLLRSGAIGRLSQSAVASSRSYSRPSGIGKMPIPNGLEYDMQMLAEGDPLRIFRRVIPRQRVKSWGYQMVKKS